MFPPVFSEQNTLAHKCDKTLINEYSGGSGGLLERELLLTLILDSDNIPS